MNELNRDYRAKESLIAKAKAEYTRKTMPQTSQTAGGGSRLSIHTPLEKDNLTPTGDVQGLDLAANNCDYIVITDPMDSRFDLEAYLKLTEAGAK